MTRPCIVGKKTPRFQIPLDKWPVSPGTPREASPTTNAEEAEVEQFYEDLQDLLELTPKKDVLFIIRDWNTKVGSQEITGVTGKFGFGVQNEAGQRLTEFCQENTLVIANILFQQHKKDSTHGHHQMVNTEIRLIIFFAPKMEKLYTVSKNKTRS